MSVGKKVGIHIFILEDFGITQEDVTKRQFYLRALETYIRKNIPGEYFFLLHIFLFRTLLTVILNRGDFFLNFSKNQTNLQLLFSLITKTYYINCIMYPLYF